jgi:tetratricopeptide (TPR) repeat protein
MTAVALLLGGALGGCKAAPETTADQAVRAVELYKSGVDDFQRGKIDTAVDKLERGKAIEPTYTLLRYDLGRMLLMRGQRNDVLSIKARSDADVLRKGGSMEASNAKVDEARALNEAALDDMRRAKAEFHFVEPRRPQEPNVPYFLSQIYTGLEDYDKALEYLDRALSIGQVTAVGREQLMRARQLLQQAATTKESSGD